MEQPSPVQLRHYGVVADSKKSCCNLQDFKRHTEMDASKPSTFVEVTMISLGMTPQ